MTNYRVPADTIQQMIDALKAARPYVECCTEPHGLDSASSALDKLDDCLALDWLRFQS
jgi:hypothetical protein